MAYACNLIPQFTVGENIMLERLPTRAGMVDYDTINRDARKWLHLLNLNLDPTVEVSQLSVAQAQLVESAKALSMESRILLLDEPTASITPSEAELLFDVLRRLRAQEVATLFVSHKLGWGWRPRRSRRCPLERPARPNAPAGGTEKPGEPGPPARIPLATRGSAP